MNITVNHRLEQVVIEVLGEATSWGRLHNERRCLGGTLKADKERKPGEFLQKVLKEKGKKELQRQL